VSVRATSKDVAAAAGVSRATVSYVLNRTPGQTIPEATRQRVLDAAANLGYTPHASARALRSGASSLALLITQELPFGVNIATLVDRLTQGTAELGLSLVTWQRSRAVDLASTLAHLQPRVVVVLMDLAGAERELLSRSGIPVVDLAVGEARRPQEALMGELQARRLAERGHRRLGVVTTDNPLLSVFAGPRLDGVRHACHELGLAAPEVLELGDPDDETASRIAAALSTWHAEGSAVTGVCAYNDVYAAACLAAAHSLGLEVPRELAVIGVDDEPMARFTTPPLTTVRLRLDEVSDAALEQIRRVLRDEPPVGADSSAHVELVTRGSA
jgi:DNA-binding LacI/PurR family transcriptional regulator